ncbi:MAG: DMT family transporter [Ignavibacteria bacterium]|jgi:drug/metabolite transporter (DMT)-like permease|nr:DMT family transporter [Ignavibacteria bacterium]
MFEYLLFPILTSLFWAISPYFFTLAENEIGVNQLNVDRLLVASIIIGIILLCFPIDLSVSTEQFNWLVLSGILGLVFSDFFLFTSYGKIGPRYSMLIMCIAPAFSILGGHIFFSEYLGLISIIGIGVAMLGIGFVVGTRSESNIKIKLRNIHPKLLIYAVLAAFGRAAGLLAIKQAILLGEISSIFTSFIRESTAAVIMIIVLLIVKKYKNPVSLYAKNKTALKWVVLGGFFGPVLGVTCSIISLQHVPVSIAQTIFATSPVFMLPISHFLFHDSVSIKSIIGVIIVTIGVAMIYCY